MTAPKTKIQKSTPTVIEQCIAYLRRCRTPKTAAQIAEAIGRPAPSVRRTLNQYDGVLNPVRGAGYAHIYRMSDGWVFA